MLKILLLPHFACFEKSMPKRERERDGLRIKVHSQETIGLLISHRSAILWPLCWKGVCWL